VSTPTDPALLTTSTGEMAGRVRALDWSGTPLGRMEHWPRSLRIAVGICLNSRFPMFVWWGPQLVNIYNDAYIPILGRRHPEALGRPAADTWDDIWDQVGPQAEAVMRRGESTWNERQLLVMQRHGYTEETYFTWSYSPIPDDDGGIGGLFCACTEDTSEVIAKRAGDQLLARVESERTGLAEAFAQSPSFLALLRGPEHVFVFANERYHRLVGRADIAGKTVREALPEVAEQGFIEILDRVYATGEPYVGTGTRIELQRNAGAAPEEAFLDFVYQPLRDAEGGIVGILADGIDVTERRQAEVRDRFLLNLEGELRPLADPAQISATGARLLGDFMDADRCAYAEVSADLERFTVVGDHNRTLASIVGEYALEDFGQEYARLMRANRPYVVDDVDAFEPAPADLEPYLRTGIRAVICVPLMKGGHLVAMMAVHQKEPRAWRPAEVELLQHVASRCYESIERGRVERTLRDSEWSFRQLAEAMPQIVFAADAQGEIDYFNRRWYEYTGLPAGSVEAAAWRRTLTPEGLERVMQAWPEAIRTGQAYEIEYPLRRHDGELRWHLGRAVPIRDAAGRVVRWYGTNTDIHDRRQIELALQQALQSEQAARSEAELASHMKDEFLATLSHELRTPLNAILGWAHILRAGQAQPQPAQVAKAAEVIERNARAQSTIIEDLLDMSAIISGKVRLEMQPVDLPVIVRAAVETARPTAQAKHIRLLCELDAVRGAELHGDPNRLQQVLWNLLNNAIKFTPADGHVAVRLVRLEGEVEVAVTDSGEGIHPDFLPFIFGRFRQGDASTTRRHGGLGLGLSIVKQLVELHGGSVRADSQGEGTGATFTVRLPLQAGTPGLARAAERARGARSEAIAMQAEDRAHIEGRRVLVVDDEPDARELARKLLEDCGAIVACAGSSAEALALLREGAFDVLLSDIGMPGEDGYALIRKVRALPPEANPSIPAMALTAYARPADRVAALRAGFQMYAAKPVEPGELVAMVASLARR
jgi:PAS domain S-box-containing protein